MPSMKELARFTLDARQVKEACEHYVRTRIDPETEEANAIIQGLTSAIVVVSRKPAPRKPRPSTKGSRLPAAGDGPVGAAGVAG